MTKILNVAAYCRISTDKNDQRNSLNNQRVYFEEYINSNPHMKLYRIYYDEGISGTSIKNRVAFNEMISDAFSGKIDLIITKEVSRFARNTVDVLNYTRALKERNIGVIFLNDNLNTLSSDDEVRLSIMSVLAQDESRRTSQRVKWGQRRSMEQGVVFGRDLFGYTVKNGELFINSTEAEVVKIIFNKFLFEDKGTHTIARELTEGGYKPKISDKWSNISILRILKNEKYVGDLCQGKTFTPNHLNHKKEKTTDTNELIYIKNHHQPIITREIWEKVQLKLDSRSINSSKRNISHRYWCSGKIYCNICNSPLIIKTRKLNNDEIYKAWYCKNKCTYINDKILLGAIQLILKNLNLDIPKVLSIISDSLLNNNNDNFDNTKLNNKINTLKNKKSKVIDLHLSGEISKSDLTFQLEKYNSEILSLENFNNSKVSEINYEDILNEANKILSFEDTYELFYKNIVDKISVQKDKQLKIKLSCIPNEFIVKYSSSGRGKCYKTELSLCSFPKQI